MRFVCDCCLEEVAKGKRERDNMGDIIMEEEVLTDGRTKLTIKCSKDANHFPRFGTLTGTTIYNPEKHVKVGCYQKISDAEAKQLSITFQSDFSNATSYSYCSRCEWNKQCDKTIKNIYGYVSCLDQKFETMERKELYHKHGHYKTHPITRKHYAPSILETVKQRREKQ